MAVVQSTLSKYIVSYFSAHTSYGGRFENLLRLLKDSFRYFVRLVPDLEGHNFRDILGSILVNPLE